MAANRPKLDVILRELSTALRGCYGDRYVRLWLYGSEARGEAHAESDVDVLLVLRETSHPTREIDRIADILTDFNLRYGVLLSVLPVEENTLKTAEGLFWRNVRREGIAAVDIANVGM
ncbi:MAG: hypothetical protein A2637_03570 [Candidatus Muproteobacteria bacterium RIFCSPHIGHO2_01_FULL_65_16]|uniref:Polymerase nucleotidyl transferase domain-containing protein n=2 Tax=Candidatus Muproteobacteria TaxID=1817795 RepID=A0A1F6TF49_9PROT|nr:MAG: hypothetical protein A2637_03570 [Candidatus Muproteobacteria bacterium RIFCSPHIGHO2_01_FULL_65_16]OGI50604.1 MAG: hypothetical protein A3B81_02295 [Candidatus Muproteobacteria bacterium RIFCSPHIGHO2_02_FULL_65_16]